MVNDLFLKQMNSLRNKSDASCLSILALSDFVMRARSALAGSDSEVGCKMSDDCSASL